ncbi:MAG TPA: formate dehydrogenase accessory protein FdhE [Rudaea sp.]
MAQRILDPGQIETLQQRSIPRIRLPDHNAHFARRAARLRELAEDHPIGDYLRLLAVVADAQHLAASRFQTPLPTADQIDRAREHRMPPLHAAGWPRDPAWHGVVGDIARAIDAHAGLPRAVRTIAARLTGADAAWLDDQADAILAARTDAVDAAFAPFVAAALQVHWFALTSAFTAERVTPLDVPGVCPLCGTLPVAGIVCAHAPYQGYRYLHCALCATEWHMVRVQCSQCGAVGKDVGYHTAQHERAATDAQQDAAVRAESCNACGAYRKIVYQEKDPNVEPLADDVASITLDLLLGEEGFHRASGNPLLWQTGAGA